MNELSKPFPFASHKWRPISLTKAKDKARIAVYIDARDVMDRLDEIAGPANWSDSYHVLHGDPTLVVVECTLVVNGTAKSDVGEGEVQESDNRTAYKDAYSDALKRAAVHHGIGRYLYNLDIANWFPVNEYKQLTPEANQQIERLLAAKLKALGAPAPAIARGIPPAPDNGKQADDLAALFDKTPPNVNVWGMVTEGCKEWSASLRLAHTDSDKPCTEKQYQFLTGLVDKLTAKGAHRDVLCRMAGDDIGMENRPGSKMASELFDKLASKGRDGDNPNWSKAHEGYVKEIYNALQLAAIPA